MEVICQIRLKVGKGDITPIYPRPVELDSKPMYWEIRGVDEDDIMFFLEEREKTCVKKPKIYRTMNMGD